MKLNEGKCHFIISGYTRDTMFVNIRESRFFRKKVIKVS